MRGLDVLTPRQVGNRAREFQASRAMIGSCRQIQLCHRRPHQALTLRQAQCGALLLQPAKLSYLPDVHICAERTVEFSWNEFTVRVI